MKINTAAMILFILSPGLVWAQDVSVSGGITLGLGSHNVSDVDQGLGTTSLDGRVKMEFGNGFFMSVDGGLLDIAIDDIPVDLDARFGGLAGGFRFENGISVGAYYENLTLGVDLLPIDLSLASYGATFGYDIGAFAVGGFAGVSETDPALPGLDISNHGVTVRYTGETGLTLAGAAMRAQLSAGGTDENVDFIGLAAAYPVNDRLSVFGGFSETSLPIFDIDLTTIGMGIGYALPKVGGLNPIASLELARSSLSAGGTSAVDIDTVRFGITIPLGGKGQIAPVNSVADSILNPRHGALNAGLTGAF